MEQYLYYQVYQDIRDKIINKDLKVNEKLESIRTLSKRLNYSTTTIERAYNQLLVEGYIKSVERVGYLVQDIQKLDTDTVSNSLEAIPSVIYKNNTFTEDLFDMKSFKSIVNKVFNYHAHKLYSPCDERGEYELREEIRKHILLERNVLCDVNQIVVSSGIQQLLHILLSITDKKSVSYLTPGFTKAIDVFASHNVALEPCINMGDIKEKDSDFLYLSPSNSYPTGDVVKVKERNELIQWAKKNNSYIIEDDYNYFIRYNSYTIPSIHSYDHGSNVIYIGSFSKTIIPSFRLSFMVIPLSLYDVYRQNYSHYSQTVSKLDQLSLALFMKEGLYKRHTKKLYQAYKEKNRLIRKIVKKYEVSNHFKLLSTDTNLHIILDFSKDDYLSKFISNCDKLVYRYQLYKKSGVIFPYSGIEKEQMEEVIKKVML